jgi:hypothetical protein
LFAFERAFGSVGLRIIQSVFKLLPLLVGCLSITWAMNLRKDNQEQFDEKNTNLIDVMTTAPIS